MLYYDKDVLLSLKIGTKAQQRNQETMKRSMKSHSNNNTNPITIHKILNGRQQHSKRKKYTQSKREKA